jgi:UDP-N-acetyl-D-glucosamine dehydrogenase
MGYDVAVVGAGYVGLPLSTTFAEAGCKVLVVDVVAPVVEALNRGESHIEDVANDRWARLVEQGLVHATTDYADMRDAEAILIALPTPLSKQREPDLSIVEAATRGVAQVLRAGQTVVLESTTWPGTTREVLLPILEQGSGLKVGEGFFLAMSPERVDPGREDWTTKTTPKVLGGITPECTRRAADVYRKAIDTVHEVSTPEAAELTKLLENIFRSVNIALVNELAMLTDRMGIDIWEVVEAASTKPYGFMRFEPGPGMGGHCLPVDPFYLSWRAREFDMATEFIELAGKVNQQMPYHCVEKAQRALNDIGMSVKGARIAVLGVSYKPGVGDIRESPALKIIELLRKIGAEVCYHDPHVAHLAEFGLGSRPLDEAIADADLTLIVTAHPGIDYGQLAQRSRLLVDLRGVTRSLEPSADVIRL